MIYKELRDKIKVSPTAQLRYHTLYPGAGGTWVNVPLGMYRWLLGAPTPL